LRCNLIRWGMKMCTRCPVCNHLGEDGGNLFFKCRLAKQLWRLLGPEDKRNIWLLSKPPWMQLRLSWKQGNKRKCWWSLHYGLLGLNEMPSGRRGNGEVPESWLDVWRCMLMRILSNPDCRLSDKGGN
jgi:hypothetical protein